MNAYSMISTNEREELEYAGMTYKVQAPFECRIHMPNTDILWWTSANALRDHRDRRDHNEVKQVR